MKDTITLTDIERIREIYKKGNKDIKQLALLFDVPRKDIIRYVGKAYMDHYYPNENNN